jgi:hypothetical protein
MNMDMDMGFTRGMQLSSLSYNTKWCVVWILNTPSYIDSQHIEHSFQIIDETIVSFTLILFVLKLTTYGENLYIFVKMALNVSFLEFLNTQETTLLYLSQ